LGLRGGDARLQREWLRDVLCTHDLILFSIHFWVCLISFVWTGRERILCAVKLCILGGFRDGQGRVNFEESQWYFANLRFRGGGRSSCHTTSLQLIREV